MRLVAQNRVAHIVEMRHFTVVEEHAVLEFARVPHHAVIACDDVFADVAARAHLAVFSDPRRAFDVRASLHDSAFIDENLSSNHCGWVNRATYRRLQIPAEIVAEILQWSPDRLTGCEEITVTGVREIEVVFSLRHY